MTRPRFFLLALLLFCGAAWALYGPVLTAFFILDDFVWLECARDTTTTSAGHIFTRHINYFFRPLVHLAFAAVYGIAGPSPAALHGLLLTLHGLAAALLAMLAWQLGLARRWALMTGLIFLVFHPLYREAMVWVSSLAEPLLAIFLLLGALAWVRALQARAGSRAGWLLLSYGAFALALGCKESAVVVWPLLLLLQAVLTRLGRLQPAPRRLHLPFAALLLAYLAFQAAVQLQSPLVKSGLYSPSFRAGWLLLNCLVHIGSHAWPLLLAAAALLLVELAAPGEPPAGPSPRKAAGLALAVLLGLLISLTPYAWFKGDMLASRYFYLPALVLALALGLALAPLAARRRRWPAAALLLVVAAMAGTGSWTARAEVARYRRVAAPVERFVQAVGQMSIDQGDLLILNSPLRGLHLRSAVRVFNPAHPRSVWGTHKWKLPPSWGKKPAVRWDPVSGHFRKVQ